MIRLPSSWLIAPGLLVAIAVGSTQMTSTAVGAPAQCVPACPSLSLVEPEISDSAQSLKFQGVLAARANDPRSYVLLGSGFIRALSFGDPRVFVSNWLAAHPRATYTPISALKSTNTRTHRQSEIKYMWVTDGASALNVDLVREGIFAGATMYDMVDNARGLERLLQSDPKLASAKAQIEKERAAAPEDRAERLISENDYQTRLTRIREAEGSARSDKLGIWSDSMTAEREAEGLP